MSQAETIKASEIDAAGTLDFGNNVAPADATADPKAWRNATPGTWLFKIAEPELESLPKQFKSSKGEPPVTLRQIRMRLHALPGQDGIDPDASVTDFVAIPTPGETMHTVLANKWLQILKAAGLPAPIGQLVPPGFALSKLTDKTVKATVVYRTDRDSGEVQFDQYGNPKVDVKMFTYEAANGPTRCGPAPQAGKPAARTASNHQQGAAAPVPAAAQTSLDL
ncbi:MAG: hypothetical protein KIPDCIKN_04348 [Haliscomenobacter sp.]|nr:hypothetical protein [Haliscomenobacter sp.]